MFRALAHRGCVIAAAFLTCVSTFADSSVPVSSTGGPPFPAKVGAVRTDRAITEITKAIPLAEGKILIHGQIRAPVPDFEQATMVMRLLADGTPDPTFNSYFRPSVTYGETIALQGSKILFLDGGQAEPRLVRLEEDGSPDATFNSALSFEPGTYPTFAVLPDGRIVVSRDGELSQLSADGALDNGFAPPVLEPRGIVQLTVAPGGNLYLSGSFARADGSTVPSLIRLLENGSLDDTFQPAIPVDPFRIVPDADGTILAAYRDQYTNLVRLTAAGALAPGFQMISARDWNYPPVISQDGRIYLFERLDRLRINRFLANGTPDPSFREETLFASPLIGLRLVEREPGEFLVSGDFATLNGHPRFCLANIELATSEPSIRLVQTNAADRVWETNGSVSLRLVRSGDVSQALSLSYITKDRSARAGVDYVHGEGTVEFASGDATAAIPLTLIDNESHDPARELTFELRNAASQELVLDLIVPIHNDDLALAIAPNPPGAGKWVALRFSGKSDPIGLFFARQLNQWIGYSDLFHPNDTLLINPERAPGEFFKFSPASGEVPY